jgi:hypothetical protein
MKKFDLRKISKNAATLGVMGVMAAGALLPATAFAAPAQPAKCAATDVKCVITAGDALIVARQTALTTLNTKVSTYLTDKKITNDQANVLLSDVATNQTGLTNLKAKLDGETVAKNARLDVANIFLQFRIYAVVMPRDYRHLQLDVERNVKAKMQSVAGDIKAAIAKAPASKQAQLNALFSDYQAQVAAAESQIDTVQNDFAAMTPENFNQNRASYEATRTAVNNAVKATRVDLHKGAQDLNEMAKILKGK